MAEESRQRGKARALPNHYLRALGLQNIGSYGFQSWQIQS
jgi:hypothetical protein